MYVRICIMFFCFCVLQIDIGVIIHAIKCRMFAGHNEDCVIRQVKKNGPNKGTLFHIKLMKRRGQSSCPKENVSSAGRNAKDCVAYHPCHTQMLSLCIRNLLPSCKVPLPLFEGLGRTKLRMMFSCGLSLSLMSQQRFPTCVCIRAQIQTPTRAVHRTQNHSNTMQAACSMYARGMTGRLQAAGATTSRGSAPAKSGAPRPSSLAYTSCLRARHDV